MKKDTFIISLDQGTTSSRAILFSSAGEVVATEQREFKQHFPQPGWVEHDANEIWRTQRAVLADLMQNRGISSPEVAALGITNQRETTVVWNSRTGEPVCNAIVWQDRRTADICEELKADGLEQEIQAKTGLVVDAYFSGPKLAWILDNVPGARKEADNGNLLFGTIDCWLIWKLTGGKVHATDYSNASRTMIFDIGRGEWDDELLSRLGIPGNMLPDVRDSSADYGQAVDGDLDIPIRGVAGDQQAALFGQACFEDASTKNTYGTGCFMLMNTGERRVQSQHGLLTTIAWSLEGTTTYALEGSVFIAGAAIQWLRDALGIIDSAPDSESLALTANPDNSVFLVPAFTGLGAPYWDMYARGAVFGLTRDSGRAELCQATLNSLAFQVRDVLDAMQADSGLALKELRVDGGACANNYLMQFQADILDAEIVRPTVIESTARGAAFLAGLGTGIWDLAALEGLQYTDRRFSPAMPSTEREQKYASWQKAVRITREWDG